MREVDKVLADPKKVSVRKHEGWTRAANQSWWAPGVLEMIDEILSEADRIDAAPYLALYRRASFRMLAMRLDEALSDLAELEQRGSDYPRGIVALQVSLLRGNKPEAQRYLDEINEFNKAKGLPRQKLSDFRL
jgi:hypothetical protein